MSTHIQDNLLALRVPKEHANHYDDILILLAEGGDNNVIVTRTGRRARDWYPVAVGVEWSVLAEVCRGAAACCGGCLKLHGRHTTPEGYIKAWRKAVADAHPFTGSAFGVSLRGKAMYPKEAAEGRFITRPANGYNEPGIMDGDRWMTFDKYGHELLVKANREWEEESLYGVKYRVFRFDLSKPDDFALWLSVVREPLYKFMDLSVNSSVFSLRAA